MKVVLLMVFLAYSNLFAQNLVYNGGFEEIIQCHISLGKSRMHIYGTIILVHTSIFLINVQ
jgi:hypothetical protein